MLITERLHETKLKKYGINICTKYFDGDKEKVRNTDNSHNDDIESGIRINKRYILKDRLLFEEKNFNPRILYSYIINPDIHKDFTCINCGATTKIDENTSCCPYCRSSYNLDYSDKTLSARYHYDLVLNSKTHIITTFITDMIVSFILAFIYWTNVGRTFKLYDIIKIVGIGLVIGLLLFYVFYVIDALVISSRVRKIKEKENAKKELFFNKLEKEYSTSKKEFFNNLNVELDEHYYDNDSNIIDYDILEYKDFEISNDMIKATINVREIIYENNKIVSKKVDRVFKFKDNKREPDKLHKGVNIIKCHNCGNNIDVTKNKCEYCGTRVNYMQRWYLIED